MSLVAMEGGRGKDIREVFERAMATIDDCDGVVILMQHKTDGIKWHAPDSMTLQSMIFYLWTALTQFGLMAAGKL
jgi:hypothetical protein